ncbi:MAG: alanyl-tRNA editing protein [Nitrososphaerales archaeon]
MTELLYLNDHYMKEFDATIVKVPDNRSIVLDKTAIYPRGGGQPSDQGTLIVEGSKYTVVEATKREGDVVHTISEEVSQGSNLISSQVHGVIDWDLRYKHMRHHTALHILSGVVFLKFNARITGGQIYPDRARLDLAISDLSKERQALIEAEMNKIVEENREVKTLWLDREDALKRSDLYRLSADLLPKGVEKLRIVEIVGFDAQLDGGTHVAKTGEIGKIKISKSENKGKDNKRIEIILV